MSLTKGIYIFYSNKCSASTQFRQAIKQLNLPVVMEISVDSGTVREIINESEGPFKLEYTPSVYIVSETGVHLYGGLEAFAWLQNVAQQMQPPPQPEPEQQVQAPQGRRPYNAPPATSPTSHVEEQEPMNNPPGGVLIRKQSKQDTAPLPQHQQNVPATPQPIGSNSKRKDTPKMSIKERAALLGLNPQ